MGSAGYAVGTAQLDIAGKGLSFLRLILHRESSPSCTQSQSNLLLPLLHPLQHSWLWKRSPGNHWWTKNQHWERTVVDKNWKWQKVLLHLNQYRHHCTWPATEIVWRLKTTKSSFQTLSLCSHPFVSPLYWPNYWHECVTMRKMARENSVFRWKKHSWWWT